MSVFEVQTGDTINAYDSGYNPETPDALNQPHEGFDSQGPNRMSIWVPSQQVVLNMGDGVYYGPPDPNFGLPTDGTATNHAPGGQLIEDGFVVKTDNHVHFHTFGFPTIHPSPADASIPIAVPVGDPTGNPNYGGGAVLNADERTVLRLGVPTNIVQAGPTYGSTATFPYHSWMPYQIGSGYPAPYNSWDGYAMVTEGGSYQESWGNNLIVSGNADVRIGGQRSVQLGSPGDVHIFAHGDNIPGVVGNMGSDSDIQGTGKWVTELTAWKILDTAIAGVGVILSGISLYMSFAHAQYARPSAVGEPGWKGFMQGTTAESFSDLTGLLGSLLSPAFGVYTAYKSLKDLISPDLGPSSSVTLYGDATVSVYGKSGATIHTDLALSASGAVAASLTSGVTTTVSSLVSTSVSGISASMSGLLSTSMTSALGSATVTGKSTAQLSSWGQVFVTGNDDVQVNSTDKKVFVHGNKGFYIGCGAGASTPITTAFPFMGATTGVSYANGEGYGIQGFPDSGMLIGKMSYANKFSTPVPDNKVQISLDSRSIVLSHGQATISVEDNDIYIGKGLGSGRVHIG